MLAEIKQGTSMQTIIREVTESVDGFSTEANASPSITSGAVVAPSMV